MSTTSFLRNTARHFRAARVIRSGAGGHIIGGGYGLLSRLHGLVIDYLHAVEVIRVNEDKKAEIITVSADSPTEDERRLFWAHQGGGGGNFGIVTKYFFKDLPEAPS